SCLVKLGSIRLAGVFKAKTFFQFVSMEELKGFIIKLETVGLQKRGFCLLIKRCKLQNLLVLVKWGS
ncbi:hypothetical protein AB4567_25485, partial [Vibrio sp. 10N.222.51.A6]